jgi:hypothetical protein
LQELLRAKCISPAEFNAAKRPLAQRLAALGVAVDCPDADAGRSSAEEWAEIDLRDPPPPPAGSDSKQPKHKAFVSPWKSRGGKKDQDPSSRPPLAPVNQNHHASVLMAEISPAEATPAASGKPEKGKRRHLTAMFGGENKEPPPTAAVGGEEVKGKKKSSWGFDGLKKWKKAGGGGCVNEDAVAAGECAPPRSSYSECRLEASPAVAVSPDAKRAKKKKLHAGDVSASDLANDKVLKSLALSNFVELNITAI